MTDDEVEHYQKERQRFDELLRKLDWTEENLLKECPSMVQCPLDRGHRFPMGSNHVQRCLLAKQNLPKDYFKQLAECEQERIPLKQSGVLFTPSKLSDLLHRPIAINNDMPISVEQTMTLLSPAERLLIAEATHNEALRLGIVPVAPRSLVEQSLVELSDKGSDVSQQPNRPAELHPQRGRRTKHTTRSKRSNYYEVAREMISAGMSLIQQSNARSDVSCSTRCDQSQTKQSKRKHRSTSKKRRKHRSSHSKSKKHRRHSHKRRKD